MWLAVDFQWLDSLFIRNHNPITPFLLICWDTSIKWNSILSIIVVLWHGLHRKGRINAWSFLYLSAFKIIGWFPSNFQMWPISLVCLMPLWSYDLNIIWCVWIHCHYYLSWYLTLLVFGYWLSFCYNPPVSSDNILAIWSDKMLQIH